MLRFTILSGQKAGSVWEARCLPFRVGRASNSELVLEDPGIWDQHMEVSLDAREGFILCAAPPAYATVNGQTTQQARLRNGDVIEIGSAQLQFTLGPTRPRSLRLQEGLAWALLVLVGLIQVALIYALQG